MAFLILILFFTFIFFFIFKVVLPLRENIRKDTYKKALKEYDEEKRKKGGN